MGFDVSAFALSYKEKLLAILIFTFIQAPTSGYYRFYLASDDESELWLSTDEDKGNARKLAELKEMKRTGYTGYQQWNK
jgi:hypothetical protein